MKNRAILQILGIHTYTECRYVLVTEAQHITAVKSTGLSGLQVVQR
jgi:hypothetical protein